MGFPTDIQAAEYFQVAYDNLSTTLTQQFNSSDTTAYVSSTDHFPSSGWFTVEDDICSYTGKTAYSFTGVTHGVGGTTPADHVAGKVVSLTMNAEAWNRIVTELRAALTKIGIDSSADSTSLDYKVKITETTITSSATPTPVRTGQRSFFTITALAENATFASPSGTLANGDMFLFRIKDNGTSRTLNWNAIYDGLDDTLPSATTAGEVMYILFIYNSASSKLEMLSVKVDA